MLHKIPMVNIAGTVMAILQPHIAFNLLLWHHFYVVLATADLRNIISLSN
jgi:hypothetical protein